MLPVRNQVLGNRYRIQERIGEGGMAFVYLAVDEKLGRRVAIKVLHEHMEKNQDIRKRFQMEAQAISSLDHPNIVKIYDFSGEGLGRLWIVTEVIKGKNLAQYVQENFKGGWLHPIIAACIVREILKALYIAHTHGIVHRDIKPENVMVTVEGQVKLMDFGIAKDLGKTSMTLTGTFMGSPSYMSPEQIRGRDVDLRSDLYSLAVLFYEIVTGRLPFTGQTTHDVVLKIMEGEFTYPRFLVPSLPDQMDAMIVRGMAKDPAFRFQTATDYAQALDTFLRGMGFDESHIELERYFKDPGAYDERLKRTKFAAAVTQAAEGRKTRPLTQQMTQRLASSPRTSQGGQQKAVTRQPAPQRAPTGSGQRTTAQAAAELPAPPPFRGNATWENQVALAPTQRLEAPPPPAVVPRPPTQLGNAPRLQGPPTQIMAVDAYAATTPAPDAGSPRRQASNRRPARAPQRRAAPMGGMRLNRIPRITIISQSWVNYVFGVVLVGLIGIVSIWGFVELSQRLANGPKTRPRIVNVPKKTSASPDKPVVDIKKVTKVKDGTPPGVVVKVTNKKGERVVAATTPAKQPKKNTKPVKQPPKPNKWANADKTVKTVPTPEAVDPNLTVETVEIKKTAKKPPVEEATPLEAPPPEAQPVATEKPAKTEKVEKVEKVENGAPENAAPEPKAAGKGKITVSSDPAAEIFIDGRRVGTTVDNTLSSAAIELKSGKHRLELKRQGYVTYRTTFEVQADEQRALPRVNLEASVGGAGGGVVGNASPAPIAAKSTALTLRVNSFPAQVTIRNLDTNTTQAFTMKAATRQVPLESGRYQVKVERKGETKERELNLSAAQGQLTFTADFKGE